MWRKYDRRMGKWRNGESTYLLITEVWLIIQRGAQTTTKGQKLSSSRSDFRSTIAWKLLLVQNQESSLFEIGLSWSTSLCLGSEINQGYLWFLEDWLPRSNSWESWYPMGRVLPLRLPWAVIWSRHPWLLHNLLCDLGQAPLTSLSLTFLTEKNETGKIEEMII